MADTTLISKKDVLKFTDLVPGILSVLGRLPSIIKSVRIAKSIQDDAAVSIGKILEENAEKYSDRPAIFFEDRMLTHRAFNQKINQYANFFTQEGVQRGDVVVVFLDNRLELVVIIAALAKIGAVASLINANQKDAVLLHSINVDPGAFIIVGEELLDAFEAIKNQLDLSGVRLYGIIDKKISSFPDNYTELEAATQTSSKENPAITQDIRAGERYANVFTSGTTGMPKASIQIHKKWLSAFYWFGKINMNLNSNDVMYVSIPFFHTNALIVAWSSACAGGAAIAIRRKFSVSNFWKDIIKYNATSFIYIGELCRYLLNAPPSELDKKHKVRKILGNGLRPEIWRAFKKRFNILGVIEFYGAADANSSFANTLNLDCTLGWCPTNYAIVKYNLEEDEPYRNSEGFMERVSKGGAGLLITEISKTLPFAGYTNKKENDKKVFRDVFQKGDQWFNSGDLLRDIGFKHAQFVDRLGDTYRWKGENVSTAEVEAVLGDYPGIREVIVYGVKIPHADGRAGMIAFIPNDKAAIFDFEALHSFLKEKLPSYAIPLVIRVCEDFDRTATHKIKKFRFKKEGLDKSIIKDSLYVRLPKTNTYQLISDEIHEKIQAGHYPF